MTKQPKPKLILHVGPQKTGTTSIQSLLNDKRVLRSLQEDGYTVAESNFRQMKRIIALCFSTPPPGNKRDCTMWTELLDRFDGAYDKNNSVILSVEELVNIPSNDFTTSLWRGLLERWDIQVILFYRPFHQWIYSMYVQDRKSLMFRTGGNLWIEFFDRQKEVKVFASWLEDHMHSDLVDLRDTLAVRDSFERLYGSDRVHVLDMSAPHGLEIEFFGNGIVNTSRTLDVVRTTAGERQRKNPTPESLLRRLDTDLLIVQGHRHRLGDLGLKKGMRKTGRMKLEAKLEEWNVTIADDLPMVCVSEELEDWLWNRTLYAQRTLSRYPLPEEELRSQFVLNRKKWCDVNAKRLLKGTKFAKIKEYLSSCEFKITGCSDEDQKLTDRP